MSTEEKPQRFIFVEASVDTEYAFDPERPSGIVCSPSPLMHYKLLRIPEGSEPPSGAMKQVFEVFMTSIAHRDEKKRREEGQDT